jgi:hypothetical protein
MYLVGEYFIECSPNYIPGDGWTTLARISRKADWRKPTEIPTAVFELLLDCQTKLEAEFAAIQWARKLVLTHRDEIEKALDDGRADHI